MLRSPLERLKNKHVERSLQQLNPALIFVRPYASIGRPHGSYSFLVFGPLDLTWNNRQFALLQEKQEFPEVHTQARGATGYRKVSLPC